MSVVLVRRGFVFLVLVRCALAMVSLSLDALRQAPRGFTLVALLATVVALGLLEMTRRHERILLGNLGISIPRVAALAFVGAVSAEIALEAAMSLW